ncbi:hypothetical protein P691DRAFT_761441 [Macrolepiota fuliginosa MF-IS2]|uniref:Uncharacterized protein n=1 Tax=Macrolepiota fuliginosa MF-IS2 TaxID=1400762 RepID=A0A9P5X9L6_9AGAR|nr:hypothetical protein P691DRAFT_761441 [Macrolepiota fuliginosa MF-IS2]
MFCWYQPVVCIFWVEIGKRMGIHDIPETPEEMRIWARAYKQEHMMPDPNNKGVAIYTTEESLYFVLKAFGIRKWIEGSTIYMLDEPIRVAMMYIHTPSPRQSAQPWHKHFAVLSTLKSTAFIQRWLMLPRSNSNYGFPIKFELTRNNDGSVSRRMHSNKYRVQPWCESMSKTVPGKAWDMFLVLVNWHSHVHNPLLRHDGYKLDEMGPLAMENKANEEVLKAVAEL